MANVEVANKDTEEAVTMTVEEFLKMTKADRSRSDSDIPFVNTKYQK